MTAAIRLITFDLDDTLWDARPALEAGEAAQRSYLNTRFPWLSLDIVSHEALTDLRLSLLHEQPELGHKISLFRETFIKRLLQSQGVPDDESTIAASEAFAAFLSHRHKVSLFADAESVLTCLHQHYQIGALTNGNADVRKTEIGEHFDFAWRAEEFGISKPNPTFFHAAFAQVGVTPEEVIHVGDCHHNDVDGAVAAGAKAIWLNPAGGLSDVASEVIPSLSDLPTAIGRVLGSEGRGAQH